MSDTRQWQLRIVGHGEVDPRTVVKHPLNPKIHPPEQNAVVKGSLRQLGWLKSIIINQTTGHLLDGEDRVDVAIEAGETTVPVEYVELPAEHEGTALMLLDQSAALAQPQLERWIALRAAAPTQEPALLDFFAQYAAAHGVDGSPAGVPPAERDDDELPPDQVAVAVERWSVALGEVWACGRHRVWCGNCLDDEGVARFLGAVVPTMVIADPPYGVDIVRGGGLVGGGPNDREHSEESRAQARGRMERAMQDMGVKRDSRKRVSGGQRQKDRTGKYPIETRGSIGAAAPRSFAGDPRRGGATVAVGQYAPVIGDESTVTAIAAATHLLATYPQAVHVWWGANSYAHVLPDSTCWLVWDKETTGHFADCELAWTNQARAAKLFRHKWNGMVRDSELGRRWHPTQKPAALMAWVYATLGTPDAVVLDPFLGSGPTLLAAEQTGPTVWGVELSPENVAIALERWARLSGETPQKMA